MQLQDLQTFATVAAEKSFSVAARKLRRTQPAISQAVRRLEDELGDRLFDRSTRNGTLTEAGALLLDHALRLLKMAGDAEAAVRELQQVRRGRVTIGANEAAVHTLLPIVRRFAAEHPNVAVDVRRVASRRIAGELLDRTIDFGVMTFLPSETGVQSITLAHDELVLLANPAHPLARKKQVTIEEVGRQVVIAHNDPSPARERVLRVYERRHAPINIQISLPSLDGIKRAVEMGLGVAVLPRRCALTEIARGDLKAVKVPELSGQQVVRFVFRKTGELSHAAAAFLHLVKMPEMYGRPPATARTSS